MNRPELYAQVNKIQRRDAQVMIEEFADKIKWRLDGNDSILDAGCGSGDVTVDILLPILPKNFQRLVGIDISEHMIEYARKTQIHPKISFEQFDLCADLEDQPLSNAQPFDHIFSFYTFHRVPDKTKCIRNFNKLLGVNGDLLLLFAGSHPIYDAYKEQSLDKRWASYLKDVDMRTPSYQHSKNAAKEFSDLLNDSGFTDCDVTVNKKDFIFEGIDLLRGISSILCNFSLNF